MDKKPRHAENATREAGTAGTKEPTIQGKASWDTVDLAAMARFKAEIENLPPLRKGKVLRVKELIENGEYETEGKFDIAIQRMLEELGA
jgi:hypothetical protein